MKLLALVMVVLAFMPKEGAAKEKHSLSICSTDEISETVLARLKHWLITSGEVELHSCSEAGGSLSVLHLGKTDLFSKEFPNWKPLSSEQFKILSRVVQGQSHYFVVGGDQTEKALLNRFNLGLHFGAYSFLEHLGFRFLHPLEPYVPHRLNWNLPAEISEKPYWPIRAWHIHTQHPIEFTNFLNGWGKEGINDLESWNGMFAQWDLFLDWILANKQNRVEWVLLMAASWQEFADSSMRQGRLNQIIKRAHDFGIAVGIDAPLAFRQQHSWTMIRREGQEKEQIEWAIDWLNQADFDYFEFEMGFSEFTHPEDHLMLDWMNYAADYSKEKYNKPSYVKVHITTDQKAKNYNDIDTGEPLNFNYLPFYSSRNLGVLPHTVQFYGLDDPAFTYGNENFHSMRRYMQWEAGRREVLFYPETAYWVSFDIDVPLFLPLYAERRYHDIRLIASDEKEGRMGIGEAKGSRIDGHVNFSSGWEWGYWLNDLITARAAWNPYVTLSEAKGLEKSLSYFTSIFEGGQRKINSILLNYMNLQKDLLIYGRVNSELPKSFLKRTGQAYLAGTDTWDDLAKLLNVGQTQPWKKGLVDMTNPSYDFLNDGPSFDRELKGLLTEMKVQFHDHWKMFRDLESEIPEASYPYFKEIEQSMKITYLRAKLVWELYSAVDERMDHWFTWGDYQELIQDARFTIETAKSLVEERERAYRMDPDLLAGWFYNPTAYNYGYLWTARKLTWWHRDFGKAVDRPLSPCYLNILDPVDVANGEGEWNFDVPIIGGVRVDQLANVLRKVFGSDSFLGECLRKPDFEPIFDF